MTATAHTDAPPAGDDLATEILRRRRRRLPALTAALALAVAIGVGIVGGIEIQKQWGSSSSSSAAGGGNAAALRSAFASRFGGAGTGRGGTGGGGFGGFGGFGGNATVGTVTLIKGTTLYVTEANGNTILVRTSPTSRVTKTAQGTIRTIHPGDTVTVTGSQAANGNVTASSIAITEGTNSNG